MYIVREWCVLFLDILLLDAICDVFGNFHMKSVLSGMVLIASATWVVTHSRLLSCLGNDSTLYFQTTCIASVAGVEYIHKPIYTTILPNAKLYTNTLKPPRSQRDTL